MTTTRLWVDKHGVITTLGSKLGGNGVAIDAGGDLYVTQPDDAVSRIDPTGVVTLVAGKPT